MLRTLLIATALLTASGAALARDGHDYGRVISVEPRFVISFGTRHHDGFRVLVESDGHHYWTHTPHHPGHWFVLPPHHRVMVVQPSHDYSHDYNYGWGGHNRRHWKDHHDDWHDRHDDRREHRRHGKD